MSLSRLMGLLLATVGLLAGLLWSGPLLHYVDLISVVIVAGGTVGLALFTYDDLGWFYSTALPRFLAPGKHASLSAEQNLHAARMARTQGDHALIVASLCTLIGGAQILAVVEDPAVIGPALAVAFLTNLYAIIMVALFFMPMNRFFVSEAKADADGARDPQVGIYAQVLSSVVVLVPMGTILVLWGG